MEIKIRLGEILKEKKMTAKELSDRTGISHVNLTYIKQGKHYPSKPTFEKLCEALGVSPSEMFEVPRPKDILICPECGAKLKLVRADECQEEGLKKKRPYKKSQKTEM